MIRESVRSSLRANLGKTFAEGKLRYDTISPVTLGVISSDLIKEYPSLKSEFVDAWPIRELIRTAIENRKSVLRRKEKIGKSRKTTIAPNMLRQHRESIAPPKEPEGDESDEGGPDSNSDHGREPVAPQRKVVKLPPAVARRRVRGNGQYLYSVLI